MRIPARFKYIGMVLLSIFATFNLVRTTLSVMEGSRRMDDLKDEVTSLEGEKADLEDDIAYKSSPSFIEKEARNKLNLIKPGEHVYIAGEGLLGEAEENEVLGNRSFGDSDRSNALLWFDLFFRP